MVDIWVPIVSAVIGGVLGVGGALLVYSLDQQRRTQVARNDARRLVVTQMLDVVEQAIHAQRLPPLVREWHSRNVALLLTLNRLMLDLQTEELPVAKWVARQVQIMVWERSGKRYIARGVQLSSKLVGWHRGDIDVGWFAGEIEKDPLDQSWKPPIERRTKHFLRDQIQNLAYIGTAAAIYGLVREGLVPLASAFGRTVVGNLPK